jgi:hypothetical protein
MMARAYWLALRAIEPDAREAQEGLAATERAGLDSVRVRLGLSPEGGEDIRAELTALLGKGLPRHVGIVGKSDAPDALLSYVVSEPARSHRISQLRRGKTIHAFTAKKPNPQYAEAQSELQSANERMQEAQREYAEFHEQAQVHRQNAAVGGVQGAIEATSAVASETAGVAILAEAKGDLNKASQTLSQTPRTLEEPVEQQVQFPVLVVETQVTTRLAFRLDGFGESMADSAESTAHAAQERVMASPSIGVDGTNADFQALARLRPNLSQALADVAARIAARIRASEEQAGWRAFQAARDGKGVEQGAMEAVMYLAATEDAGPHAGEVVEFLQRSLP